MSFLDKCNIATRDLNYRRPEDPQEVMATLSHHEDNQEPKYNGFTYETAFITEIKVQTVWYANQAQFQGRQEMARQEILHFMYGPVLNRLAQLRARVADRDWRAAMKVVDDIQSELVR